MGHHLNGESGLLQYLNLTSPAERDEVLSLETLVNKSKELANITDYQEFKKDVMDCKIKLHSIILKFNQNLGIAIIMRGPSALGALRLGQELVRLKAEIEATLYPWLQTFSQWLVHRYCLANNELTETGEVLEHMLMYVPGTSSLMNICSDLVAFTVENMQEICQYDQGNHLQWAQNLRQAYSLQLTWYDGEYSHFRDSLIGSRSYRQG